MSDDTPSQTARDTKRAQSRLSDSRTFKSGGESRNAATQRDTDRAASRVTRSEAYTKKVEAMNAAATSVPTEAAPQHASVGEEFVSADTPYFGGGGGAVDYAFKVVDDGDGTVSVLPGAINTEDATDLEPTGKPTELWLKATLNTSSVVTAAAIVTASVTDSATESTRKVADITWDGDVPTITQGIKGTQNLVSCGASHGWSSLYL